MYSIGLRATGQLVRGGVCQDEMLAAQVQSAAEFAIFGHHHDVEYYVPGAPINDPTPVVDREAVPRPLLPAAVSRQRVAADGMETAIISIRGVKRCKFRIDGIEHETTDGMIEISSPMPATYIVEIDHWPFLPWRAEIKAT
jgi:hypothetical protein